MPERHHTDPAAQPREWASIITEEYPFAGYALQKDSPKAIAIDPLLLYPYSQKKVKYILDFVFFGAAILATATGILPWLIPITIILWALIIIGSVIIAAMDHMIFLYETFENLRALKNGDRIGPARGTHAPKSSMIDLRVGTGSFIVQESGIAQDRSESPTSMSDNPRDGAHTNDGDTPVVREMPSERTTGFEAHSENETFRRPVREDTESNIGLDSPRAA